MTKKLLWMFLFVDGIASVYPEDSKLMLITIPKSGTHLLEKCMYFMDMQRYPYDYNKNFNFSQRWATDKQRNHMPPSHWRGDLHPLTISRDITAVKQSYSPTRRHYDTHIYYLKDFNDFLDSKNFKKILLLRDPRAVLVSFATMVKDGFESQHKIAFEDLLLDLIDGRQQHYIPWASSRHPAYPFIWEIGLCDFYKMYLPFIKTKNCLTVRFEALVGAKGGGSDALQIKEIKRIAEHVGITLTGEKIKRISNNLFGNSATFHKGTINGWKKYFTPKIKKAFQAVYEANELLVALGYENKLDW